jgi:hypothetical protein
MQRSQPDTTPIPDLRDELLTMARELRDGRGRAPALWEETEALASTRNRAPSHVRGTRE